MGYYTQFVIKADSQTFAIDEFIEAIDKGSAQPNEYSGSYFSGLYWSDYHKGWVISDTKWYDHEDDLKWLSSQFPDVLFTVKGHGEDGDRKDHLWMKYFKGGKMQASNAHITYEEFDESKLR